MDQSPQPLPNQQPQNEEAPQASATLGPTDQSAVNPITQPPATPQPAPAEILRSATIHDGARAIWHSIRSFISFVIFVGTVAAAALLINQFIFQAYYVDGTSMVPTLQNNDRLIVDKTTKTIDAIEHKAYLPNRGDVVTFISTLKDQNGQNEQLIKRVIGLPGDTINIQNGIVTVTNKQYPSGFDVDKKLGLSLAPTDMDAPFSATVPADTVYVLGDNRAPNGSYDSRFFGPVPLDAIQGRLVLRVFPFSSWTIF